MRQNRSHSRRRFAKRPSGGVPVRPDERSASRRPPSPPQAGAWRAGPARDGPVAHVDQCRHTAPVRVARTVLQQRLLVAYRIQRAAVMRRGSVRSRLGRARCRRPAAPAAGSSRRAPRGTALQQLLAQPFGFWSNSEHQPVRDRGDEVHAAAENTRRRRRAAPPSGGGRAPARRCGGIPRSRRPSDVGAARCRRRRG